MYALGRYPRPKWRPKTWRLPGSSRLASVSRSPPISTPVGTRGSGREWGKPPEPFQDPTTPGQKKVLQPFSNPQFETYHPGAVESSWYQWWEASGFFQPRPGPSYSTFVVHLPPPNVTGPLHCGHALGNAIQDTLVRWNRMRGARTLWIPGCDHAGIWAQYTVEQELWKREKKTRFDIGREAFTRLVWDWVRKCRQDINDTQRLMGGSMDWSREVFTMDEGYGRATVEAFCRLYEDGQIYRADRLVHWSPSLQTTVRFMEMEVMQISDRTLLDVPGYDRKIAFGEMTYYLYPVDGTDSFIEVGTTRPETMLGDTGIAVHPTDGRYAHLVGKYARHPFTQRLLKIVADNSVDSKVGTGALKITPAHDYDNYTLAKRHGLDSVNVLNEDGTMNENAGIFQGQKRFDCRDNVVEELTKLGLFVKKEPHPMEIAWCKKTRDVLEVMLKKQWWVKTVDMAEAARQAVKTGKVKMSSLHAKKSYVRWLELKDDWCISRPDWWGHRVPAYRVVLEGPDATTEDEEPYWVVARTPKEAEAKAKEVPLFAGKQFRLEQDLDCLDVWFSSALWPMASLGWPNKTPDYQKFFPASFLDTGWDIMQYWVSRMLMLSLKLTGLPPFQEIHVHGMLGDSEGVKMGRSFGNAIDPVDIIRGTDRKSLQAKLHSLSGDLKEEQIEKIAKRQADIFPNWIWPCGADGLRLALLSRTNKGGKDFNFDLKMVTQKRQFCISLWRAARAVFDSLPENFKPDPRVDRSKLSTAEKLVLHRMNRAVRDLNKALHDRDFYKSTCILYQFVCNDFMGIFLPGTRKMYIKGNGPKQERMRQTLYMILDVTLRMCHPFVPFITEELWQRLPRVSYGGNMPDPLSIMLAPFPREEFELCFDTEVLSDAILKSCSQAISSVAAEYEIRSRGRAFIRAADEGLSSFIAGELPNIQKLARNVVSELSVLDPSEDPPVGCAVSIATDKITVFLHVAQAIPDIDTAILTVNRRLVQQRLALITKSTPDSIKTYLGEESRAKRLHRMNELEAAQAAITGYEQTLEQFRRMKSGDQQTDEDRSMFDGLGGSW